MDDREFIDQFEDELRNRFFAPFDGRDFFNRDPFNYILDQAGVDPDRFKDGVIQVSDYAGRKFHHTDHRLQMVVDQRALAIAFELTTPTKARHFRIAGGALTIEDPEHVA